MESLYLVHHGIMGQKWGVRRYQNPDGTLTEAGKERLSKYVANEHKWVDKKWKRALDHDEKQLRKDEKRLTGLQKKLPRATPNSRRHEKLQGKISETEKHAIQMQANGLMHEVMRDKEKRKLSSMTLKELDDEYRFTTQKANEDAAMLYYGFYRRSSNVWKYRSKKNYA